MSFFSIMAVACVLYSDGQEHCDVRTKAIFEAPSHAVCVMEVQRGIFQFASSALANDDVVRITLQEAFCYSSTAELSEVEQLIPLYMDATNRTHVLTRY